jgi:VCBS repeat-containing protein
MKRFKTMNTYLKPIVAACALAMAAGQAGAVDYYLAAKAYTKQLPMADGTLVDVPMWGYVLDTGDGTNAHCYSITGAGSFATRRTCVENLPDPGATNPELVMPAGDTQLRIFLTNNLEVHTSIVIPGQELPWSHNNNGPTWNDGSIGSRCATAGSCTPAELSKKVRSYTREAGRRAGRRAYVWNNFRGNPITGTGTLMYHSGTLPQLQVYMGLFGAVSKDAAAGEIYSGVPYDNQVTLMYSEIDPDHNAAVSALDNTYATSYTPIEYHPKWYLINGEPYVQGSTPNIPIGTVGDKTLLRFLSAAGEKHVSVLQGLTGTIHAEDGIQYTWQDGTTGVETIVPKQQYSVGIAPLKTKDVIIEPSADGVYAVYDGNGFMTNPSDPNDITSGDSIGGMLRYLEVGAAPNTAPVANLDSATVEAGASVGIDVLANDTDVDGDLLTITAVTNGTLGTASTDGSTVTYTSTGTAGADSITYDIDDGNGGVATGSVDITVIAANTAPVATDDVAVTDEDTPLSVAAPGVLSNDSDAETDPMTAVLVTGPTQGSLVLNADGSFDYTPNADANGADSFTYTANDATGVSNVATVSITINPVNDAPVITSTPVLTGNEGQLYSYDVDATDVDGDTLTYSLDAGSVTAGLSIDPNTGVISWTPAVSGPQPVTVTVTDTALATATQSFTIDVAAVVLEEPPVAAADTYAVNEDALFDVAAPGVLSNDTATNGDAMTATLISGPSCAWTGGPSGAGAFVLNTDGSFHYEPIPNWNSSLPADNPFCNGVTGDDAFTYVATDNDGNSNVVTVSITVNEMNDAPIATADTIYMTAMGSMTFPTSSILGNDGDVDLIPYDPAQVFAVRETANNQMRGNISGWNVGVLSSGNDSFTYNFANGRVGVITSFDYHVTDSIADSNTVTVTIRRELSVQKVECENDTENGVCKWVIEGRISGALPNNTTTIEAVLDRTGQVIGTHVETGGQAWSISPTNTIIPQPGDTISVRALHATDPDAANAFIDNFPVTIQ